MAERDENLGREDQSSRGFSSMDNQQQEVSRMDNESSDSGREDASESSGRRSNRGFAAMDPGKQKEIASEGGRARDEHTGTENTETKDEIGTEITDGEDA